MTNTSKRIVIIGATSAIAEHCARLWLSNQSVDLTLVSRDLAKTQRIAADLQVRSPQSVIRILTTDFCDAQAIQHCVADIIAIRPVHTVLIAHGTLPDQQALQQDLSACAETLMINGISPALFAEAFATQMQQANYGTLAVIGSVAGDRGRKSNYCYGSAKGLVERFVEGLQHRLAHTAVKVTLIKPGPTATPMTAHIRNMPMAKVEDVAQCIVTGIAGGKPIIYAPTKWALIMLIIRHLPRCIFHKMNI